jgi:hypothetical protein
MILEGMKYHERNDGAPFDAGIGADHDVGSCGLKGTGKSTQSKR